MINDENKGIRPDGMDKDHHTQNPSLKPAGRQKPPKGAASRQHAIGEGLQQLFSDVMDEPVPAEFLDMLNELERQKTPGTGVANKKVAE